MSCQDTNSIWHSESSSQDSDDDASSPPEGISRENEEDEDVAYDQLVESITNLVLESSCLGNIEERAVPVEYYVHSFLEQVASHQKPATADQTPCFPMRAHPMQINEAAGGAGEVDRCGRRGQGGSRRGNKRKSNDGSGHGDNDDYDNENNLGDSGEEEQNDSPQQSKKLKTGRGGRSFGCPFRKRNPTRFNIREHNSCAMGSFSNFALAK